MPSVTMFLEATGFAYHSTVWDLDLPPRTSGAGADMARRSHRAPVRPRRVTSSPGSACSTPHSPITRRRSSSIPQFIARRARRPGPGRRRYRSRRGGRDRELVGFCATDATAPRRECSGTTRELWSIGVRPDRQGQGTGAAALRAGVERVRSLGIPNVSLSVNGRNESALGLYESEGFVRIRTRDRWSRPVEPAAEAEGP